MPEFMREIMHIKIQ